MRLLKQFCSSGGGSNFLRTFTTTTCIGTTTSAQVRNSYALLNLKLTKSDPIFNFNLDKNLVRLSRGREFSSSTKFSNKQKESNTEGRAHEESSSDQSQEDDEEERLLTSQILKASLNHVNQMGWTLDAIKEGARDVDMTGEISSIFTEYDLVHFFIASSNQDLEGHLETHKLTLQEALEYRVRAVVPFAPNLSQALALATHPNNFPTSLRLLMSLSDSIAHHALKDTSTDINWYTKRLGIASIYVSTELCLVQDKSENYKETFQFLERRVKDFDNLGNCSVPGSSVPVPEFLNAGITTVMNMLGRNPNR